MYLVTTFFLSKAKKNFVMCKILPTVVFYIIYRLSYLCCIIT
nr:MAG TPA: hypothetical protein [Caudoviricetes sp.]